jgi:hypothetical protein
MKKAGRLFWRGFSSDRLCISVARGPADAIHWPSRSALFCCVRVRFLPESQNAIFSSTFLTFQIQAFRHQKTAPQRGFLSEYLFYIHRMAGAEGFEPSARGFGVDVEKTSANIWQSVFRAVEPFVFLRFSFREVLMLY